MKSSACNEHCLLAIERIQRRIEEMIISLDAIDEIATSTLQNEKKNMTKSMHRKEINEQMECEGSNIGMHPSTIYDCEIKVEEPCRDDIVSLTDKFCFIEHLTFSEKSEDDQNTEKEARPRLSNVVNAATDDASISDATGDSFVGVKKNIDEDENDSLQKCYRENRLGFTNEYNVSSRLDNVKAQKKRYGRFNSWTSVYNNPECASDEESKIMKVFRRSCGDVVHDESTSPVLGQRKTLWQDINSSVRRSWRNSFKLRGLRKEERAILNDLWSNADK